VATAILFPQLESLGIEEQVRRRRREEEEKWMWFFSSKPSAAAYIQIRRSGWVNSIAKGDASRYEKSI
jgi:hypothetical protein